MRRLDREKENAPQYSRYLQVPIPNHRHTPVLLFATLYSISQKQRLSLFEYAANRSADSVTGGGCCQAFTREFSVSLAVDGQFHEVSTRLRPPSFAYLSFVTLSCAQCLLEFASLLKFVRERIDAVSGPGVPPSPAGPPTLGRQRSIRDVLGQQNRYVWVHGLHLFFMRGFILSVHGQNKVLIWACLPAAFRYHAQCC